MAALRQRLNKRVRLNAEHYPDLPSNTFDKFKKASFVDYLDNLGYVIIEPIGEYEVLRIRKGIQPPMVLYRNSAYILSWNDDWADLYRNFKKGLKT